MAKKYGPMIKKLQRAINEKFGQKILVNHTQFYSEKSEQVLEMIVVKKSIYDEEKQKSKQIELFSSTSDVQIVLYLRDYWYELNGWEVPTDNEEWQIAKQRYIDKHV